MGFKAVTAPGDDEPVTMLELYFDLVFVFSVTQLTTLVLTSHGATGYLHAAGVLLVTWWMYDGYAWLANNVSPTTTSTRLPMLLAMTGFLVMAIQVPDAFGEGALLFALAYLVVVLVHGASFARSSLGGSARAIVRILPVNLGVALLLVVAALVPEQLRWVCWVLAAVVLLASVATQRETGFTLRAEHFAERHRLLVIIALGETIIATGVSAQGELVHPAVLLAVLAAMALISSLWWVYFAVGDDERGVRALEQAPPERMTRLALWSYSISVLVLIAGLVLVAAGLHEVVHAPSHTLAVVRAVTFAVGSALACLGLLVYLRPLGLGPGTDAVVAAGAALLTALAGILVSGMAQLVALVAVVVVLAVARSRRSAAALTR